MWYEWLKFSLTFLHISKLSIALFISRMNIIDKFVFFFSLFLLCFSLSLRSRKHKKKKIRTWVFLCDAWAIRSRNTFYYFFYFLSFFPFCPFFILYILRLSFAMESFILFNWRHFLTSRHWYDTLQIANTECIATICLNFSYFVPFFLICARLEYGMQPNENDTSSTNVTPNDYSMQYDKKKMPNILQYVSVMYAMHRTKVLKRKKKKNTKITFAISLHDE